MWYNSIEFYVIAGALAAGAVAAAALPQRRGKSVLHMSSGELAFNDSAAVPTISAEVDDNGRVILTRNGLANMTDEGEVSLAINVMGAEIAIEERITPGRGASPVNQALFFIDFLAPERYHVKYNSEDAGLFAAFTLNVLPGIHLSRELK